MADSLTLATHNAYWFQGAPSLWGEERTQARPEILARLADLYAALEVDVLFLQEVPAPAVAAALMDRLDMEGAYFPGGGRPAYGGAILWRGLAGRVVDLTRAGGRVFERVCLQLEACGTGPGLRLVGLHLASNRFAPQRRGENLRLAEVAALFAASPAPDVVAGDFNAAPDSAVYAQMRSRGYTEYGGSGGTGRPRTKRVDYIWVRDAAGLLVEGCATITDARFIYDADRGIYLSDHPPVCLRLHLNGLNSGQA